MSPLTENIHVHLDNCGHTELQIIQSWQIIFPQFVSEGLWY